MWDCIVSQHEADGGEAEERERLAVEALPVLGQPSAAAEPSEGAFAVIGLALSSQLATSSRAAVTERYTRGNRWLRVILDPWKCIGRRAFKRNSNPDSRTGQPA
jgi:hypothetical protein